MAHALRYSGYGVAVYACFEFRTRCTGDLIYAVNMQPKFQEAGPAALISMLGCYADWQALGLHRRQRCGELAWVSGVWRFDSTMFCMRMRT